MNRKTALTLAAFATAALVALGCGSGSATPGTTGDKNAADVTGTAGANANTKPAAFGKQTKTLADGIVVSTNQPVKFKPDDDAAGHQPGNSAFAVNITITNKGTKPLDLTTVDVQGTIGKEGTDAERVFNSNKGISADFDGMLQPGRKRTVLAVFSAPNKDTSIVGLQVTVGFGGPVADFEGPLAAKK